MNKCKWLSDIIKFPDLSKWKIYEDELYELFVDTFITNHPTFNNKPVHIKKYPLDGNREHAFTHLTCKTESNAPRDVNDRLPDLRRAERLNWIKPVIENYPCLEECINCNKIKYWEELYKNKIRINLFFEDFRYFVVLEDRGNYYLLITAYYIHYDEVLEKKRNKYIQYCKQKKPLI